MANLDEIYDVDDRTAAFENHESGVLVSLAGPGTGKTYSLLRRIEALTKRGEGSDSICYLTFVNEISNAFIADYTDKFGLEAYETCKPRVSTLHSFACRLIRNEGFRIGYDGHLWFMGITNSEDGGSETYIDDLLTLVPACGLHTPSQLKKVLERIKAAWRDCVDPLSLEEPIPSMLPACLDLLRAYRLVDFDQTIPTACSLLRELPWQPGWISRIRHFLVDEYQDFNRAEQQLITALSATARSMVVVGDDDQSLYSSRGGSPDGLRELYLSEQHDQVSLLRCYRCKSRIVEAANRFQAAMRPDPRPMRPFDDGGRVVSLRFKSTKAEMAYLAEFLLKRSEELPANPKLKDGTVCLFPSHKVLDFYFDQLSPQVLCSRRKPTSDPTRLWLERALGLVRYPGQRFLQRVILEDGYSEVKPRHKKKMVDLILRGDISPADALGILVDRGELTGLAASQASAFRTLCKNLASHDSEIIAAQISPRLDISADQLTRHVETFLGCLGEPEEAEAVDRLCDELIPDSVPPPVDPRAILFLTMHGSKGLTRNTVVMPGLEEAWLPGDSRGSALDEKRRLFYVALTRATDRVLITYPTQRARRDPLNYTIPGRGQACSFVGKCGVACCYHE